MNDEKVQQRAAERDAGAQRDQRVSSRSAEERSQFDDERLAERESREREGKRLNAGRDQAQERAGERRSASHDRSRAGERAEGDDTNHDDTPDEVPAASNPTTESRPMTAPGGTGAQGPAAGSSPSPMGTNMADPGAVQNPASSGVVPQPGAGQSFAPVAAAAAAAPNSGGATPAAGVDAPRAPRTAAAAAKPSAPPPAPTTQDMDRAEAILRQVRVSLQPGLRSATINLNPAELGRMTIRLRVKDGGVNAVIRAESEATLGVLERHLPELRAMLAQQGFEGAEFDLGLAGDADLGSAQEHSNNSSEHGPQGGQLEQEIDLDPMALARPLAAAEGGIDLIA